MCEEDTELMRSAAQGDPSAFEKVYRKYLPSVQLYLRSRGGQAASVPDMVQEVFTRLWGHRQQYAGRSTLKTYVLGYADKIFREEQRRRRRTKALADYFSQNPPRGAAEPAGPELEVVRAELRESLDRAIARLTVGHQQAVRLYYAERMSLEKAAQAAGCTRKCFASRLLRARRALRDLLKGSR